MTQLPTGEELLPRFAPTAEQNAILEAALNSTTSIMVESMAGCSKTSTIEILIRGQGQVPTIYLVFNKKNQIEAEKKFKDPNSPWAWLGPADHAEVKTLNGFGHQAWSKAIGRRLIVKATKLSDLLKDITKNLPYGTVSREDFTAILSMARRARVIGLIPSSFNRKGLVDDNEVTWKAIADHLWLEDVGENHKILARKLLTESIRQAQFGTVDFDDQIYMSSLFGGVFPKYEHLYGDEVQDYSPTNKRQILLANATRLFLVGDSRQAIYAFRGADSKSMESLRSLRNEWIDLPLSVTFRCPKTVVARQQGHAPGYAAADSNPDGLISNWIGDKDDPDPEQWSINKIPATEEVAILCRNNAPLFAAALKCLKAGRGCVILGSEIGRGLITLARKIAGIGPGKGPDNASIPITDFKILLKEWYEDEYSLAEINDEQEKAALIKDKFECLMALAQDTDTLGDLITMLTELFSRENVKITLATGHKAKGLEWSTVIHLDPHRIPAKPALIAAQNGDSTAMRQESNLRYVIETRAKRHLILANAKDMV